MPRPKAAPAIAAFTLALAASAGLAEPFSVDLQTDANAAFTVKGFEDADRIARAERFRAVSFDTNALRVALVNAPIENEPGRAAADADPVTVSMPLPEGGFEDFAIVETQVMHPDLQTKFPEIRTYIATSVDNPARRARMSVTPLGVRFQLRDTAGQSWYVDPIVVGNDEAHASYRRDDMGARPAFSCGTHANPDDLHFDADANTLGRTINQSDGLVRTYRIAVTTTNEYTAFFGGTVASGLSGVVESINRITGIYEDDLGVRFQLVPNNDELIFVNPDPFSFVSLSAVDNFIDQTIGSNNYDVGHLFDQGGGGFAQLGVVCTSSKGRGYTGLTPPTGDPFWVDYAAHELGHQFAGTHTFNGVNGACSGGNRTGSTAWEPGSGTTIMGYAGICGSDNTASNSDPVFHGGSIIQMRNFIESTSCPVVTSAGNTIPNVDAGPDRNLPANTPFLLTAAATDPDNNDLTYAWEQFDLGPARSLNSPDNGTSPLFRSFDASTNPTRYFPRLSNVVNGFNNNNERLPTTNRNVSMIVTVRDNAAPAGDTAIDRVELQFTTNAGPFTVTQPTPGTNATDTVTVTWNRAGTQASPINEANVAVLLSTNGGQSFDITLTDATPNDGNETLDLPRGIDTNAARILVRGVNNPFFNVNPGPFTATGPNGCSPADIAPPFGFVDLSDSDAFIAAFATADPLADIAEPFGFVDLTDVDAFIAAFTTGCP